jgi:FkbM family methyltransferase
MLRATKELFKKLQYYPILWILVAIVGTIQQSMKHRAVVLIFRDLEGDWINKRKEIIIASPDLNVESYNEIKLRVDDTWLPHYKILEGDVIVDAGAGIGNESVYFSRLVKNNGLVLALEPHPATFRCLKKTISLNDIKNIIPIDIALSSKDEELAISSEENHLANSVRSINEDNSNSINIKAQTLDSILSKNKIDRVNFLKMNIEGMEYQALLGSKNLLSGKIATAISCHDFMIDRVENPEEYITYNDVKKLLETLGHEFMKKDTYFTKSETVESKFYLFTNHE